MAASNGFSANELFDLKHLLKCVSFLRDLTPKQLEQLVDSVECLDYTSGDPIFEQDKDTVPALYLIRQGHVWLRRQGEDPVKLMQGCHFGEDLLEAAEGKDDKVLLPAPYNITAEHKDVTQKMQCARVTLESCRKIFKIDNLTKVDNMYIRRKSKNYDMSGSNFVGSNSVLHSSGLSTLSEESEDDHKKHKKKKKESSSSDKKKKTTKKLKPKLDVSVVSEDSSSDDVMPARKSWSNDESMDFTKLLGATAAEEEAEREAEPLPEPKKVAPTPPPPPEPKKPAYLPPETGHNSFADIRKNLQEKSKDQPNPLAILSPSKSPRQVIKSPTPPPPASKTPTSIKERVQAPPLDSPPKPKTKSRHSGDEKEKKPKGEKKHRSDDDDKKKKKKTDSHLHKARQTFDERSKKTRKDAKESKPPSDKPYRPPPNVFQKPLPLILEYQAPEFSKSQEEEKTITRALSRAFPFKNMQENNMKKLIAAFEPTHVEAGVEFVNPGKEDDYFYIVNHGKVVEEIDGEEVRTVGEGEALGDMNLVHSTKNRMKSVRATTDTDLFRVDQTTYRKILQTETAKEDREKRRLLDKIALLQNVSDRNKKKLASLMKPIDFKKGETIVTKADYSKDFYVIENGTVKCQDPDFKNAVRKVGRGGFFGETALVTGDIHPVDVTADSDVTVFKVSRELFEKTLGLVRNVIISPIEARTLCAMEILRFDKYADLTKDESNKLVAKIDDRTFAKGQTILEAGEETSGKLFFVRGGRAEIQKGRMPQAIVAGGVFGEDVFETSKDHKKHLGKSKYRVIATEKCVCGVLRIKDYLAVAKHYATPKAKAATQKAEKAAAKEERQKSLSMLYVPKAENVEPESSDDEDDEDALRHIAFQNLVKRVCLGEGNFGQVWMVSDKTEKPPKPYALKIQSKYQLVQEKQAEACIREKEAMAKLKHPNIVRLAASYQDDRFVYMLLPMIQGGELFNLMHPIEADLSDQGLPEASARFYAFVIADAIAYLHEKRYVYRDLKPENVLIDNDGYPVLIDFGFAKRITEKTYTLCGTPGYLPPECCLSRGHTFSADHWSYGILVYEMICGESPFYFYGIDQQDLYRAIIEDDFDPPMFASMHACDMIDRLLVKDPLVRLGSLSGGESDILCHQWFDGLDSYSVRKRTVKAPWKPELSGDPFDVTHFDDWSDLEDKTNEEYPELKPKDAAIFEGF